MTTIPPSNPIKAAKKIGIRLADDQERTDFITVCHIFEQYKAIESLVIPPKIQFKGAIANNFRYVDVTDPHKQKFTLEYMWEVLRGKLGMSVNLMYRIYYHIWRCKDANPANFIHPVVNPWALMDVRVRMVGFYTCLDMAKRYKNVPTTKQLYRYWIDYYLISLRGKSIWVPKADLIRDLKLAGYLDKFNTPVTSSNGLDTLRRNNGGASLINNKPTPPDIEEVIAMSTVYFKLEWLSSIQRRELNIPMNTTDDPITDDDRNDPCWPENWVTTTELYQLERDIADWMKELYFTSTDNTEPVELIKSTEYVDKQLLDRIIIEKELAAGKGFMLTNEQRQAIYDCITYKCNVLIGYPGTGKSTIVDIVTQYFYALSNQHKSTNSGFHISLCALSGMATIGLLDKCKEVKRRDIKLCGTIDKLCHTIYPNLGPLLEADCEYNEDGNPVKVPDNQVFGGDIIVYEDPRELMDNFAAVDSLARLMSNGEGMNVKIGPDMVIVDEFSMVDLFKFHDLLYFVRQFDCRLLLVGDYNQLPSIGPGALLRDMVDQSVILDGQNNLALSNNDHMDVHELRFHVNRLTEIKRQDTTSQALVKAIKKMTTGVIGKADLDTQSFRFLDYNIYGKQSAEIATDVAGLVSMLQLTAENSKFICPQNGGVMGAIALNNILQHVYNPLGQTVFTFGRHGRGSRRRAVSGYKNTESSEFRLNDLVVRIENDYSKSDKDVYVNGDRGRLILAPGVDSIEMARDQNMDITSLLTTNNNLDIATSHEVNAGTVTNDNKSSKSNEPKRIYMILYEDGKKELVSNWELYQSFRLAYALTIHKAQGSQFENAVVVMTYDQRYMWTTPSCESYNLLYTAISRAVKRCIMVGRMSILMKARQHIPLERFSSLF